MSFMNKTIYKYVAALGLSLFVLSVTGCGGPTYDTGLVSGTITLDGAPLASARIQFQPESGSPSSGYTDSDGKYELKYTRDTMGAEPGMHEVSISTFVEGNPFSKIPTETIPERVPTKYNKKTELTAEVVKGKNTHDFALSTEGAKVEQPEVEDDE